MTKQERIVSQTEALIRYFKTFAIDYNNAKPSDGWQKDIETLNALLKLARKDVGVRPLFGEDVSGDEVYTLYNIQQKEKEGNDNEQ